MLSHLRFHKRDRSNPASPVPPDSTHNPWADLQPIQLLSDDGISPSDGRPRSSHSIPFSPSTQSLPPQPQYPPPQPPILPPISRVTDDASEPGMDYNKPDFKQRPEPRSLPVSPYHESSSFIGGLALRNLRREQDTPAPPNRPPPPVQPVKAASSFISPTDMYKPAATGKRPPGARAASDSQGLSSQGTVSDQPRPKKSLPFLKNPVSSLLLRRKTSQNFQNLSLQLRPEEPAYDPSIRGTRVHDFSAPRPRKTAPISDAVSPRPDESAVPTDAVESSGSTNVENMRSPGPPKAAVSEAVNVPLRLDNNFREQPPSVDTDHTQTVSVDHVSTAVEYSAGASVRSKVPTMSSRRKRGFVPPTISPLSRNASGASFQARAIPKHMKSTSSRFSFDMMGAANEEKLLEERHRQKQQDRQAFNDDRQSNGFRDSRFDDFDEDAFDYDAMDYDDGLEERIPGVNADYEEDDGFGGMDDLGYDQEDLSPDEDEQDPDNDQENFSGFVFQRSDPTSLAATPLHPAPAITPRDADGNVVGYASAGTTPTHPPVNNTDEKNIEEDSVPELLRNSRQMGLGIHGSVSIDQSQFADIDLDERLRPAAENGHVRHLDPDDELCFKRDDFSGEGDGSAFDESLFDLDDTDQYGRPIPGAFASALAQRSIGASEAHKHESEATSRISAQTGASQSTAHTSFSVEPREQNEILKVADDLSLLYNEPMQKRPEATAAEKQQIAAYQAALAAAACQAAASGKFDRDSPPSPTDLKRQPSAAASSIYSTDEHLLDSIEDYEADDDAFASLDDYELDDDAIIAEANASALANDSDGWYGQEFGFYAAPAQQQHLLQSHQKSSKSLTEQNLYQYSHGGFFGPSGGLDRSMSGHAVLREPNLTPITERSEYSNRNSIMSLGIPPGMNSAPLQSPGLAQLAMMADDDDMSLSALLRLRSKAWGGSQASLSSREGSPCERNGATSPWGQEPSSYMTQAGRKNSAFSLWSQDSAGAGSNAGSPTITMASPTLPKTMNIPPLLIPPNANSSAMSPSLGSATFASPQPSSACHPVFEDDETDYAPTTASISNSSSLYMSSGDNMPPPVRKPSHPRSGMGHRHKGSADSISYTKEEESGETRWVLERRRTAESGEMELLGREIIQGGRI